MSHKFYHTGEFARKASVSVRTLRYYDQQRLLCPSMYTDSGHRLYTDDDLARLQYILGLKFLGFSLDEIRACLEAADWNTFHELLAQQKTMMLEKRQHLDAIISAISESEKVVQRGSWDWDAIVKVIQVVKMDSKKDWVNQYFTPEQQQKLKELSDMSYSEEGKKSFEGEVWTEEHQKEVDAKYSWLYSELTRLVKAGASPGSPEAQAAAKVQLELIDAFTQGNPERVAGLKKFWENFNQLPDDEKPPIPRPTKEEQALLNQAIAIYRANLMNQ
ncbi:MerR family transcriptional regulator [Alicyclobacillus dauci]|uniref:MerR family transcriptional regulator n=1 Tax=Alicyclobacillus dauci TaxID=1475485 RepID=A0ABY6Z789_9BACL|nr:MerR family transcriptional regulator [Alicyclobacillus dauci]WAH38757.1 MerR family transcriptional regulator [Alicyclobacillus dauci]